jgi:protein TonB
MLCLFALAGVGWWQWQHSWNDLEKRAVQQIAPLRVAPEIMTPRIVAKVEPLYPEEARRAGTQGTVLLDTVIAVDGSVKRLQTISGDDTLAESAAEAVRQWKFDPYRASGRALEVETPIAVEFRLH